MKRMLVRRSGTKQGRNRFFSRLSRTRQASARLSRTTHSPAGRKAMRRVGKARHENYHLATLALVAVIIFLAASIAVQFKARSTGYVTAKQADDAFWVVRSYTTGAYDCQPLKDNYDPYKSGYVRHSGNILSRDSCIDSSTLLEYSCDASGNLKSDIGVCKFGCVKEDVYGRCR